MLQSDTQGKRESRINARRMAVEGGGERDAMAEEQLEWGADRRGNNAQVEDSEKKHESGAALKECPGITCK